MSMTPSGNHALQGAAEIVLVLGDYRQSLTVFRSLAAAGYRVIFGTHQLRSSSRLSRHVAEIWMHEPIEDDAQAFVVSVAAFVKDRGIAYVFPIGEKQLECFALLADAAKPIRSQLIMPDDAAVLICLDKAHLNEVAVKLEIPCAETRKTRDCAEVRSAADALGYPCVVKPNDSRATFFGRKAIIAQSAVDLETSLSSWPAGNEFLLVQNFVDGQRHNCYFGASNGALRAYYQWTTTRTNRADGTGIALEGLSVSPDPVMQAHCEKLVAELNYSGVGCVQFIVAENTGTAHFLEINPRLGATCAFAGELGLDFPRIAMACLLDDRDFVDVKEAWHYPSGKRFHWPEGDIHEFGRRLKNGELTLRSGFAYARQMIGSFIRADVHETWSWRDPLPTVALYFSMATGPWRWLTRRLSGLIFSHRRLPRHHS